MSNWPRWRRAGQPGALAQYVLPDEAAARLPGLPGRGSGDALGRLRRAYEAFADAGVTYEPEPPSDHPDWQVIRPPDQVLLSPRHATCLDAAVVFAGACLHAGLHPLVVIADSQAGGEAAHAVVIVWLGGKGLYPRRSVLVAADDEALWREGVRPFVDGPGEFLALDPTCAMTRPGRGPATFEEAVAEGVRVVRGQGWRWRVGVDVGVGFNRDECFQPALRPAKEPLDSPYADPATLGEQPSLRLLRAEYGLVPFQARDELDVLLDWCAAPGAGGQPRVAVVTGVGGAGKTRLVAELAHRLAGQDWYTGFVPKRAEIGPLAKWLAGTASPLLVAIDYAEARWAEAAEVIAALRERPGSPTCVVLTARETAGGWLEELDGALTESRIQPVGEFVHLQPSHVRPERVFRRALEAFSARFDTPRPDLGPPRRRDSWTTLDVVLRAWLAALGTDAVPTTRSELYDEVLTHERRYWRDTYKSRSTELPTRRAFNRAAACLTLVNPEPDRATEALAAVQSPQRWREYLAETLAECLASQDSGLSIKPDPIGDHLAMKVFGADGPLLVRCLAGANEAERWAGLVNLTRAGDEHPEVAARLATAALAAVDGLWQPALALAAAVGGPCVSGLAALASRTDTPLPLVALAEEIPFGHATLRPVALAVAQRLVDDHRAARIDEPAELARLLHNLSLRLSEAGRRAEALAVGAEAVALRRRLADADPAAFLPNLAASLNNQTIRLSEAGRRAEALTVATEAVALYRRLADADPVAFLPDLAGSLNNQTIGLSEAGRRAEGLAVATEAVALHRWLAGADPAAFLPDLAMSLNTHAARLSEAGRRAEALAVGAEAVALHRRLAGADPAAFLPDLAMSLHNHAALLSKAGRRAEGLAVATEAVALYRQLADADPAAFLPNLAVSLSTHAARLSEAGRRAEALAVGAEAVALHRRLAGADPVAFLPNLAGSLHNHAILLSEAGRRAEALAVATEAVALRRQLADADPAAFLPDLAASLNNHAARLSEAGRRAEALAVGAEAVAHYRRLADADPVAFLSDLAGSLDNQAALLSEAGRRVEALTVATEAVALYRWLADADPAAFLSDLAGSLNNQAIGLSEAGRGAEALAVATEAVALRRRLADADPVAFLPDLAMSLNNQATGLSEAGRRVEALAVATEAVALYRRLADADPAAFLPDLAMSLNNQATGLSEAGRGAEALAVATEAVALRRRLADADPAAFLPDLAGSLNNQAIGLSEAGRRVEALAVATEAVALYRRLADADPAAFLPDLAGSLNNQATGLSEAGRGAEALAVATEAVALYRRLADADPAAFLSDLAGSLNNQAIGLSEAGRGVEALTVATEAAALCRRLADADPAAFLPDLAMSLNSQANLLSEAGRRAEALAVGTEAVALCRRLADADPAAFLSDLAMSLHNHANRLSEAGRRTEALTGYGEVVAAFADRPGYQAELLASRAAWRARHGDAEGALADLLVLAVVQASDAPGQLEPLGRARREARELAAELPAALSGQLPAWATAPIAEATAALVDAWAAATRTRDEAALLAGHGPDLADPATAGAVRVLAQLYPEKALLARCIGILEAIAAYGPDATLAALEAANDRAVTLREWIATPTWSASRDLLEARRELLLGPDVEALLEEQADDDATATQHLAIVRLCRQLPIAEVYDLITDVTDAAVQATDAIQRGDGPTLQLVLLASPDLARSAFHGPAALATLALLAGHPDDALNLAKTASAQGTPTQRRALAGRLARLAAAHPNHAPAIAPMLAALNA
ncbi:MAG: tetratricopeptide repeat protein [Egibacteraceae bacterium]